MSDALSLDEDRYFDPEPHVRRVARELHEETSSLGIVSPHGHVDARILADDAPFPEPASLIVVPDHYILRMLHSHGVPLERLGVPANDETPSETDPRRIWQLLADHYHLFRATPSAAWLDYQLFHVFGVRTRLDPDSATRIYDQIAERLASPEFRPRVLFDRFNIEVLATTDAVSDTLEAHEAIRASGWTGRVIPTLRPDGVFQIAGPSWRSEMQRLADVHGAPIGTYAELIAALERRREHFRSLGATATDHGVFEPYTERLADEEAERLFERASLGMATGAEQRRFEAHLLMEMARMSIDDGLVMQMHCGSWRDHHQRLYDRFGANQGADIPVATEFTRNLRALLNAYGNDSRLRLIVFTLDESTYARELAPLAGHYPALRLGPAWWFHDSIQGMQRYREQTTETAGIYNTAGFNDDTRAFCSIPARHDLSRRVDANWLAGLVARHVIDMRDARAMARALAYDLVKDAYRLDIPAKRPARAEGSSS
jgi:glucuronate isomerase